ncbi:hypothetical protein ACHAXT_001646 [Thalassiosira profunda]
MGKRGKSKASTASKKSGDKRKKSGEGRATREGRESKAANTKGKKQHELHVEFPVLEGDDGESYAAAGGDAPLITPTVGCIAALAAGESTNELTATPVLLVLNRETGYRDVAASLGEARQLEEGDVIRHRGTLPDCLEYAIKAAYPEECSEDWTGYKDAPSKKKKHSDVDTDYY